jgi:hypothetical protein
MALVEVVLTYRPHGTGDDLPSLPLGRSDDPHVLRVVRERLIEAARVLAFIRPEDRVEAEVAGGGRSGSSRR